MFEEETGGGERGERKGKAASYPRARPYHARALRNLDEEGTHLPQPTIHAVLEIQHQRPLLHGPERMLEHTHHLDGRLKTHDGARIGLLVPRAGREGRPAGVRRVAVRGGGRGGGGRAGDRRGGGQGRGRRGAG